MLTQRDPSGGHSQAFGQSGGCDSIEDRTGIAFDKYTQNKHDKKKYSALLKLAQVSSDFFKFMDKRMGLNVCLCQGLDQMSSTEQTNIS